MSELVSESVTVELQLILQVNVLSAGQLFISVGTKRIKNIKFLGFSKKNFSTEMDENIVTKFFCDSKINHVDCSISNYSQLLKHLMRDSNVCD